MLDKYLVNNLKQHQHCISPDSEYITLIAYAITLGIDLCNFLAIWAVLSILLDTMSSDLQYVQCLQQVFNNYCEPHTQDAMIKLEQQAMKIQDVMYDSMTKHNFDRVSGAVDRDLDKVNTNSIKPTVMIWKRSYGYQIFYYICQICCLRLGLRSSGFTHD